MGADEVIAGTRTKLETLIAPISGGEGGVGRDVSYEGSFEAMKAEVDKLTSMEGGKVDWASVSTTSETILGDESKDFRVALYFAVARAQLSGVNGLFDGLVVLDALMEAFWEPMYPGLKRPRARGNLCSWFADFAAPVVDAWNPVVKDREAAFALDAVFKRVDGNLAEKLGEAYPGMLALREAVRRLMQRVPAEPPPPAPDKPPPSAASPPSATSNGEGEAEVEVEVATSSGGGGFSVDDITDNGTAYQFLAEIVPGLKRASQVFREADSASPEGHRLARVASLLFLNGPLSAEAGETQIDAPDEGAVQAVTDLANAEDWEALARAAESVTSEMPLWLDGHYHAATAYQNLGEAYDGARRVIESEIAALAIRVPGIADLRFAGGVRLASEDTKAWMGSLAGAGGGGGGGGGGKDPVAKALLQAQEMMAAEQLPQAIALMQRTAATAQTPSVRFRTKLEGAKLAMAAGYADLARAQLEGLDRLVTHHRLDEWDPDLAVQLYSTLYRAQRASGLAESEAPEARARVAATWERLCQLDGAAALRLAMEAAQ